MNFLQLRELEEYVSPQNVEIDLSMLGMMTNIKPAEGEKSASEMKSMFKGGTRSDERA
jgi:hypothetical protein